MKKKLLFILLSISCYSLIAQSFTDHNSKNLFNLVPVGKKNISYSIGGTSIDGSFIVHHVNRATSDSYVLDRDAVRFKHLRDSTGQADTSFFTSLDESAFFISVSAKNISASYKDFFTNLNQPTTELSLNYAFNNVQWINWDTLNILTTLFKQYDAYVKVFANNTFSNFYDVTRKTVTTANKIPLLNYGAEFNIIGFRKKWWLAFTASAIFGMPVDNLKSYQSSVPQTFNSTYPIIAIGKSAGKYATELDKNQVNGRTSISGIIFLKDFASASPTSKTNFLSYLCLVPFYAPYTLSTKNLQVYQLAGFSIGVLHDKYNSKGKMQQIKPLLELGVDFQTDPTNNNKLSTPNWIFSFKGTF